MKRNLKSFARSFLLIVFGNIILAFTVKAFIIPVDLVTGGATGIALAINHYTDFSISILLLVINAVMLLVGWIFLGSRFAAATVLSSVVYPLALEAFDRLLGKDWFITEDMMLCAVFAGIGMGAALGIVFREGASTGGMDVVPLILNKYFKLNVSVLMYVLDAVIILAQMIYGEPEEMLYGIISIIIYTVFMNRIILNGTSRTELKIVSEKSEEIRQALLKELDRSVTMIDAEGGYSRSSTQMVLSIVSNRELYLAEKLIRNIDPQSFIVITRVNEVKGRGFSLDKEYSAEPPAEK